MSRTYRWKMALGALLLSGSTVLATQGCTVTTGDGGDFDAGGNRDTGTQTCDDCLFGYCSGQWSVCQGDSQCEQIYRCAISCTGEFCVDDCYNRYPAGKTAYRALSVCDQYYACGGRACSSKCGTTYTADVCSLPPPEVDAGGGTVYYDAAPQDCQTCTNNRCASQKNQCAAGSDCEGYSRCTLTCTDPDPNKSLDCVSDCGEARPAGKAASEALGSCTEGQCKTECGL